MLCYLYRIIGVAGHHSTILKAGREYKWIIYYPLNDGLDLFLSLVLQFIKRIMLIAQCWEISVQVYLQLKYDGTKYL